MFALLAVILVLATEQVIEHFARRSDLAQEKNAVNYTLSTLRARLEGVVNSNLLLVHGLTAVISAQPNIGQAGFARIARGLVDERHALRNIAGAPDMVVSLMYPLAGNEAAIGLDYRAHPTQAAAALRVRDTGQPVVAGPLNLLQGGVGVIAREPVFVPAEQPGGKARFWGVVSAVIDIDLLYRQAGLVEFQPNLRLAIRGTDGTGAEGPVFYGDARVFASDPVTRTISLPGGAWQMAALPAAGWGQPSRTLWLIRLLGLLAALAAGVLTYRLARGSQALSSSDARMRALLNTIPDLVWLKDPDGVYLACNARFESLYGANERGIVGKTDYDFVPAEMADFFRANDRAAIASGVSSINEEWLTFAVDGRRVLAETIKTPVHDAARNLIGVLGIARDITERKQVEAALRDSEAKLRLFIEHAPASLAMFDRDMRYISVSRRWLTDYEVAGDILGRSHYDVFPEISERWKTLHQRGLAGEVLCVDEDQFVRENGTLQWLRWEIRPWHTPDGSVGGIVIFSEDISERKQNEQRIQGLNRVYAVLSGINEAIVRLREPQALFDEACRIAVEQGGFRMAWLGMADEVSGEVRPLASAGNASGYLERLHISLGEDEHGCGPTGLALKQGQHVVCNDIAHDPHMAPWQDDALARGYHASAAFPIRVSGQICGAFNLYAGSTNFFDAAELRLLDELALDIGFALDFKRAENEIRQLNAELEQRVDERTAQLAAANKELETFTYSVSHDLKAPLRGIDGYSRLLLEDHLEQLDDEGRLFLGNVRHGVDQMSQLIEDLLAYSRMERRDLHGIALDLALQVAAVLHERADEIAAKGVQIQLALDACTAQADPDGFAMVLRNLIDNALKFTRDSHPPMLLISGTLTDKTVTLAIKDNGIGFDMKFQDRIFEIFQRLQRAEDYPGTGVGLAIVRKAMQRMGGRVWAESALGKGATFYLELPR